MGHDAKLQISTDDLEVLEENTNNKDGQKDHFEQNMHSFVNKALKKQKSTKPLYDFTDEDTAMVFSEMFQRSNEYQDTINDLDEAQNVFGLVIKNKPNDDADTNEIKQKLF